MTLDHQANNNSTTSTMVYGGDNSNNNKTFFGSRTNNTMMSNSQNVPSSPLLTSYSYLNSTNQITTTTTHNGGDHIPQLSMSLMDLSLSQQQDNMTLNHHHHHDNVISTSTSPNKLPFTAGGGSNNNQAIQPTHQQSLSLDSNGHQRDLSPRFDIPFGSARQRGNSSGFPPIGGHLTKLSPRVDVNPSTTSAVYNQGYHPQSPALPSQGSYDNNNNHVGYVGSPLLAPGTPTNQTRQNVKLNTSFNNNLGYSGYNPASQGGSSLFGSAEVDPLTFGLIPSHPSPSMSPSNSPRVDYHSANRINQQSTRALLQGGRSNSMPPIPAFTSGLYKSNDIIDMDRMNNHISKSVNMKILEEDELDSFSNNIWYSNNPSMYPVNNNNNGGYNEEQYVVGQMEMSPSQSSPLMSAYAGYLDSDYSSSPMGAGGYKGNGYKQMPYGINLFPNTSNIQMAGGFNQMMDQNMIQDGSNGSSTDSDDEGKSQKHPGEYPSRTLFVRNISSVVDDQELRILFETFGAIRQMYTSCKHRGFVMITYYDIRHAKQAKKNLQSKLIKKRKIDIHYSIPKENPPEKEQLNQETLVVFNLDPSITNEELKTIFTQFGGDVKEIRETPNKKFHKFIEFYDTRDAERALKQLNKTELKGKKIKIEYSRPGGLRNRFPSFSDSDSTSSPTLPAGTPGGMETIEISTSLPLTTTTTPNIETLSPPKNDALLHPGGNKSRRPRAISAEEKEQFKLDLEKVRCGIDKRTTLMVKNIPNKYTQKMLLETVDVEFKTSYDFFYLPIDFKNKCNVGYAFINFADPKLIIPFVERFNRKKWEKFNSEKVCDITYARIQGKIALINHFQNSSLMCEEEDCRPIFC